MKSLNTYIQEKLIVNKNYKLNLKLEKISFLDVTSQNNLIKSCEEYFKNNEYFIKNNIIPIIALSLCSYNDMENYLYYDDNKLIIYDKLTALYDKLYNNVNNDIEYLQDNNELNKTDGAPFFLLTYDTYKIIINKIFGSSEFKEILKLFNDTEKLFFKEKVYIHPGMLLIKDSTYNLDIDYKYICQSLTIENAIFTYGTIKDVNNFIDMCDKQL